MVELYTINPLIDQMVLTKLGMYCSERLSVDLYYLAESINLLISEIGEEVVKKEYSKKYDDWEIVKSNLIRLQRILSESKMFYDAITDKSFNRKTINEVQKMFKKQFINHTSRVPLLNESIYKLFVFLVSISTIQRRQIKGEYFKILEHKDFRKIPSDKSNPKIN